MREARFTFRQLTAALGVLLAAWYFVHLEGAYVVHARGLRLHMPEIPVMGSVMLGYERRDPSRIVVAWIDLGGEPYDVITIDRRGTRSRERLTFSALSSRAVRFDEAAAPSVAHVEFHGVRLLQPEFDVLRVHPRLRLRPSYFGTMRVVEQGGTHRLLLSRWLFNSAELPSEFELAAGDPAGARIACLTPAHEGRDVWIFDRVTK